MQRASSSRARISLFILAGALLLLLAPGVAWAAPSSVDDPVDPLASIVPGTFDWRVVVNNKDAVPGDSGGKDGAARKFNSYNQPSVNIGGIVVFRARSKGAGGEPAHGVFTRDMSQYPPTQPRNELIGTLLDRATFVPYPNNLGTKFTEPPSFPRIDMVSETVATRGNHPPVYRYLLADGTETRAGTTGIYTNPSGSLITGMSNLGAVFDVYSVPGQAPYTKFDVFPGSPAVTGTHTIVFKGNFTVNGAAKTGVFYRVLEAAVSGAAIRIADTDTTIPGSDASFGSTAPPSAADGMAVFAGFDNEAEPTEGGIYLAPLAGHDPDLNPLVEIGDPVPGGDEGDVFNRLGEGVSFDGRFVAFWGAWGNATRSLVLQCPEEGNAARLAYCLEQWPTGFPTEVPMNQGIFVHDIDTGVTTTVARAPSKFTDFVYWNFSGRVPGTGGGHGGEEEPGEYEEPGEMARWRSATFLAVSGLTDGTHEDGAFQVVFKGRTGKVRGGAWIESQDGIYLASGPATAPYTALVETGMPGTILDNQAVDANGHALPITEMGVERDGFRGDLLAITARMGTEESGHAGIYLAKVTP